MTETIQTLETGETIYQNGGAMTSVYPAESFFGYTYWSLMIPPFKPKNMLVLGYGQGTVVALTEKIWGNNLEVTNVDILQPDDLRVKNFLQMTAYDFVMQHAQNYDPFDYIVIDLYNGTEMSPTIYNPEFIEKIAQICSGRISINIHIDQACLLNDDLAPGKSLYEKYFKLEFTKPLQKQFVIFFKKVPE